jgi:hypothetical protein
VYHHHDEDAIIILIVWVGGSLSCGRKKDRLIKLINQLPDHIEVSSKEAYLLTKELLGPVFQE